jgi:hypothetical protein
MPDSADGSTRKRIGATGVKWQADFSLHRVASPPRFPASAVIAEHTNPHEPTPNRMNTAIDSTPGMDDTAGSDVVHENRLWRDNGWTCRVIKNEDDDGWAVEMTKDGETEPALVGPWTMGRDKKNPKPLDVSAFNTLVKTASEVLRRHEQQLQAQLHKQVWVDTADDRISVTLDIVPDDDDPHALLAAENADGESLARIRVAAGFKLSVRSATDWIESGYTKPR